CKPKQSNCPQIARSCAEWILKNSAPSVCVLLLGRRPLGPRGVGRPGASCSAAPYSIASFGFKLFNVRGSRLAILGRRKETAFGGQSPTKQIVHRSAPAHTFLNS